MENNKKLEDYFANFKDYNLISTGKSSRDNSNPSTIPDYDLISTGKSSIERTIFPKKEPKENLYTLNNDKKTNYPDYNTDKNNQERVTNNIDINHNIKNSLSKKEIRKKTQRKKILKAILIGAITVIIAASAGEKLYTHFQTEQIKKECIITMYDKIEEQGYDIENLNLEEFIKSSEPDFLKENLFEIYLVIEKNYHWKEANQLYDLLVQKAGLANSFERYLINEGYHDRVPYSSNGENYYLSANRVKWENAMESIKLAEKRIQETKSKGAR